MPTNALLSACILESTAAVLQVERVVDRAFYAIKSVRIAGLSKKQLQDAIAEVKLLASMDSPYVVRYFDSFIEGQCLHIVAEYCNSGDLKDLLITIGERGGHSLPEKVTWGILLQVRILYLQLRPQSC
jgi:NIMA (never in mitosis gene a)-related kinase